MSDFTYSLTALTSYLFLGILILICTWGLLYNLYKKKLGLVVIAITALIILLFILWNVVLYVKSGFNG